MAFVAQRYSYGRPWIFALRLIGLTPLAERLSFLIEYKSDMSKPEKPKKLIGRFDGEKLREHARNMSRNAIEERSADERPPSRSGEIVDERSGLQSFSTGDES
ncbi:hypothetical protein L6452_38909 [Arctium lappa]|uniref:Uncharacterized protein n=1 Tax=Arctium lappa TaxID=4217 RepID=A0ACB8XR28_ARCLA|nr:hypothetical protein L6452_38909 [Arctium lappa]